VTSPIHDEEDSYDAHLARRLVRAATTAVSMYPEAGARDPHAAAVAAAHAVMRVLEQASPPDSDYSVDFDFHDLADLVLIDAAAMAAANGGDIYRDRRPWRVGNHYDIHIYAVNPEGVDDESIGTAHSPWAARQIVAEHNVRLSGAAS